MRRSLSLAVYLALSPALEPVAKSILRRRIANGKEDPKRSEERFGHPSEARPEGEILWLHSASVGEVISILKIVEVIGDRCPDLRFLITTGTLTSAELLRRRMPERTVHQFLPYDFRKAVTGFLNHWRPSVGIWTESELWPVLVCETHRRNIPLMFINGRMSARSYRRWRWLPGFVASLLNRYSLALVQDDATEGYLRGLGLPKNRIEVTGSIKMGAATLPHDPKEVGAFKDALRGRPVWLAASTHPGEEQLVAEAHALLTERHKGILLILVPRHPDRGSEVAGSLTEQGYSVERRSAGAMPTGSCQIYVADTLGELGIWYRIAPVSFIGGSMVQSGGHNPYEPALLGSAIVHGHHIDNFRPDFARLESAGATICVSNPVELSEAIETALQPETAADMTNAAFAVCAEGDAIVERAVAAILAKLPSRAGAVEAA